MMNVAQVRQASEPQNICREQLTMFRKVQRTELWITILH